MARQTTSPLQSELIESFAQGKISRRGFMVRGSVVGLSTAVVGAVLAACGSSSAPEAGGTEETAAGGTDTTAAQAEAAVTEPVAITEPAPPAGGIKQGGTLRVASQKPGSPLDPVAMDNLGTYTVVATSFEYLCGKGEGAALAPALAESWSPNADGSEWTFKLRSGVKWHDGTPFTSADVVGTIDRLAEANLKAYVVAGAAKATDDTTVTVTLNAPDGQFPYQLSLYNPQSLITPKDYAVGTTLDKTPAGTGPFKLEKYDVAQGATFVANADWWGGKPYLDKVEFLFSDDIATQMSGLQGGAADALVQFGIVGGEAILASDQFVVESIRGAAHRQLWMNVREGNFTDVRVRQAVALGIDRQALIDTILQGRGDLGNDHPIAPVYEYWDSAQPQRGRDVEAAKKLLADAGKTGLKITMHAPKLGEIPQLAEVIQTQLKDIGMEITLNIESTDTFYDRWCKVYDGTNEPAGCDGGEEFGIVDYGNRGTPDVYLVKAYATGEWNSAHYNSEPFKAAVAKYQASLDTPSRAAAMKDVQAIATEDVPYVIPYFYNSLMAYSGKVSGIVASGLGHYELGKAGFVA